jgi:uncharacterized protein with beta-barrel porin domain
VIVRDCRQAPDRCSYVDRLRRFSRAGLLAVAALLLALAFADDALARCTGGFFIGPGPAPKCLSPAITGDVHQSGQSALFDAGSLFLQHLGALSSFTTAASTGNNPQGGGADTTYDRYRVWLEGYGLGSRTAAQGSFTGDHRRTYGGVAGAGVTVAPGVTLGLSVDQNQTNIDVANNPQRGRIDLTQVGAIASFENGPWNLGTTLIHGFGTVHSSRFDTGGTSTASYFARLWGAMAELSYYQPLPDNSRFVPKLTFDWVQSRADSFVETGGANPIAGSGVTASRVRMLVGGEIGHSWLANRTIMDLALYGRLVDNLSQRVGTLLVSDLTGIATSTLVAGIRESTLGADAGVTLSAKVSQLVRLYVVYDGRFRSNYTAHSGTVGAEFRW